MKNYETDICFNCGASMGLHHYETMQCPKNGIEETRFDELSGKYYSQQWQDTFFEDSGIKKVENAAFDLLEALIEALECINNIIHPGSMAYKPLKNKIKKAIKKATE